MTDAETSAAIENGVWNISATVVGTLTGAVGSILVVRSLSLESYGLFSYYMWLAAVIAALGTLAFPSAVVKITSELRGSRRRAEAETLSRCVALCVLSLNLVLTAGVLVWAARTPAPGRFYLVIIAIVLAPSALAAVWRSTLWGREHYRPVSVTVIASAVLQLGLVIVASRSGWGGPGFAAALLSTNIVQAVVLTVVRWAPSRTEYRFTVRRWPEAASVRRYLAFATPATLVLLYEVVVWQRSEIFFLERFSDLAEVGFYNLASTVFGVFLTAGWALVSGFYPAVSRSHGAGEWSQLQQTVRQGLLLVTIFAVPVSFGGWATLAGLITLLYTSKMLPAVPVMHVLLLGLLPGVMAGLLSLVVKATGGIWLHVRIGMIVLVVNIGLAVVLIPHFGALGGAVTSTVATILYAVLLLARVHRICDVGPPWRALAGITGIGAAATFVVPELVQRCVPGAPGVIGAIASAGFLYVLAIWRFGYIRALRTVGRST